MLRKSKKNIVFLLKGCYNYTKNINGTSTLDKEGARRASMITA